MRTVRLGDWKEFEDRLGSLAGWAFRYKTLEDGRRQILNFLLPGDLLGLQGELLATLPHGVEALTEVNLCAFATDAVPTFFRDLPAILHGRSLLLVTHAEVPPQLADEHWRLDGGRLRRA